MFASTRDGGDFENIFNRNLRAEDFILSYEVKRHVDKFIKEFNMLKQRKAKGSDWLKEYNQFFGAKLVSKHGEDLDQITPSAAEFLCSISFVYTKIHGDSPETLLQSLKDGKRLSLIKSVDTILTVAKQSTLSKGKRWTPLFQSQTFFNSVVKYLESPPRRSSSKIRKPLK